MGFLSALVVYLGIGRERGSREFKKRRKISVTIRVNTSW